MVCQMTYFLQWYKGLAASLIINIENHYFISGWVFFLERYHFMKQTCIKINLIIEQEFVTLAYAGKAY